MQISCAKRLRNRRQIDPFRSQRNRNWQECRRRGRGLWQSQEKFDGTHPAAETGHAPYSDRAFPAAFDPESNTLSFTQRTTGQGVKAAGIVKPGDIPTVLDMALRDPDEPYLIELELPNAL